jgi:hypothetical protein
MTTPRPTSRRARERPGRQLERTELAWERSTSGLLAAAAVLLFRHVEALTAGRLALAAFDLALALVTAGLGRRRGRLLRAHLVRGGGPRTVPDASREVLVVSVGALLVAAGTVLLIAAGR